MKRTKGFSLLEIMIAMAILSGALVWLIVGVTRNIKAENHAKLMTAATFLARGKMVDIEDDLYKKGFGEFEKELNGTFDDKGFSRYTWRAIVDKIELPTVDQLQSVLTKAQQGAQQVGGGGSGGPGGGLGGDSSPLGGLLGGGAAGALGGGAGGSSGSSVLGAGAGMLAGQFGMIKDVLEQAIRRVTIKIGWIENGRPQEVELVAFYTDVRRVDQAIQIASAPPGSAGAGGTPGGGAGGSGGSVR
jgi:general secretion pathway protein I